MSHMLLITLSLLVMSVQGVFYTNSVLLYASAGSQYQLYIWGDLLLVVGKTTTVTFGITAQWYVSACASYCSLLFFSFCLSLSLIILCKGFPVMSQGFMTRNSPSPMGVTTTSKATYVLARPPTHSRVRSLLVFPLKKM